MVVFLSKWQLLLMIAAVQFLFVLYTESCVSAVILTEKLRKCEQFFSQGFSIDYGRSQLTAKKTQDKYLVIFVQNLCKVAHPETAYK